MWHSFLVSPIAVRRAMYFSFREPGSLSNRTCNSRRNAFSLGSSVGIPSGFPFGWAPWVVPQSIHEYNNRPFPDAQKYRVERYNFIVFPHGHGIDWELIPMASKLIIDNHVSVSSISVHPESGENRGTLHCETDIEDVECISINRRKRSREGFRIQ